MKYLSYIPGDYFGGCEDYAVRILEQIIAIGHTAECIVSNTAVAQAISTHIPNIPAKIIKNKFGPEYLRPQSLSDAIKSVSLKHKYKSHLLSSAPSIVHAILPWHYHSYHFLSACLQTSIPLLISYQLVAPNRPPSPKHIRLIRRLVKRQNTKVLAISNNNRDLLSSYYGIEPQFLPVIPNRPRPASKTTYSTTADIKKLRQQFLAERQLSPESIIVLTVAALNHQKGIDILLKGVKQLTATCSDLYFCVAGDGPMLESYRQLSQSLGVSEFVRFLGHRTDVDELLQISDIFLFPTRYEGESFALLEAARSKLPIVASNASNIPETFRDGVDALLFPVDDYATMANQIKKLLANPSLGASISQSAFSRIQSFNEADMLCQTSSLLEALSGKTL